MKAANGKYIKTDEIKIVIRGTKKFRQEIVDIIYQSLMNDDLETKFARAGNGLEISSSIAPSDDVVY